MTMNRRGFLGGIVSAIASSKLIVEASDADVAAFAVNDKVSVLAAQQKVPSPLDMMSGPCLMTLTMEDTKATFRAQVMEIEMPPWPFDTTNHNSDLEYYPLRLTTSRLRITILGPVQLDPA